MSDRSPKSNAASRTARRDAAHAELLRAQAQQRRSRLLWTGAVVLVIVAIFAVVAVVGLQHKGGSGAKTTTASAKLTTTLSSIPASSYDAVGKGTVSNSPVAVSKPKPLTAQGKPKVLYVGAEYCPYCAAERWAMVTALARFGTFSNLGETTSSHTDVYPDTPTLSFHGSTYTSQFLTFNGYETQSNQVQGSSYAPLDKLPDADGILFDKFDAPPYVSQANAIPFIDFGGLYVSQGVSYSPQLLSGLTQQQVADQISDTSTTISQSVLGTANTFTAALCQVTKQQPAAVCLSPGVTAAAPQLGQ
jgi:hypothetical protein